MSLALLEGRSSNSKTTNDPVTKSNVATSSSPVPFSLSMWDKQVEIYKKLSQPNFVPMFNFGADLNPRAPLPNIICRILLRLKVHQYTTTARLTFQINKVLKWQGQDGES